MNKIIHVDMDYFYAQVEEQLRPELKNRPIAVGGSRDGRGVLCTCNYIARAHGVRGAMPTFQALKICPELVVIPPQFDKYKEASSKIFDIFRKYTPLVQGLSLDEAYLDVSDVTLYNNSAIKIAENIKMQIHNETGLTASAGVSYNKLLSKIASELNKPNGLAVLTPDNILEKIKNFPIHFINGVGQVTRKKLNEMNIHTFGDALPWSKLDLINHFGSLGPDLYSYVRGIDHRKVEVDRIRKSLSVESTFTNDEINSQNLLMYLGDLTEELTSRLLKYSDRQIKSIFVKVKFDDFQVTTHEKANNKAEPNIFYELLNHKLSETDKLVRLLGVGVRFHHDKNQKQLELL